MAARTSAEIASIRAPGGRYGDSSEEWRPYAPEEGAPLALYASDVAVRRKIVPKSLVGFSRSSDLSALIDSAEQKNEIAVLFVDPWSAMLPGYQELIRPHDAALRLNMAIVVPWDASDELADVIVNEDDVRVNIAELFRRNRRARPNCYSDTAGSLDQFKLELDRLLVEAQSLLFEEGAPARPVAPEALLVKPIISGPRGAD